jgi:hypothetical protein
MCSACNGGLSDDDSVTDSRGAGYYCSTHYNAFNTADCGVYDRDSFYASNRCCICGAGYSTNNDFIKDANIRTCSEDYDDGTTACGAADVVGFKASLLCTAC